jgi:hypothetical protein
MNNFKVGDVLYNSEHDNATKPTSWRKVRLTESGPLVLESTIPNDEYLGTVVGHLSVIDYNVSTRWRLDETYRVENTLAKYEEV